MVLGLNRNEVRIERYNERWKEEFLQVRNQLTLMTDLKEEQIEHIGSTAIQGIYAKPIIDILAGIEDIDKDFSQLEKDLRKTGFYRLRVERPNEVVFAKFQNESFQVKTHFLHLVNYDGELWKNLLFFRDYLRENEEERKMYEALKRTYTEKRSEGIEDYTNFKESFVNDIIGKRAK